MSSKSFLIKDILSVSKNDFESTSDESIQHRRVLWTKPIGLRRYYNHLKRPLCPVPVRPSVSSTKDTSSPLDALFEMTKKTFDKSDTSPLGSEASFKLTHELHKRKRRKNRTAFSAHQIYALEKRFTHQRYLTPNDRDQIANELQLSAAQVITWFQNRRAKLKRDYEELKNDVNAARKLQAMGESVDFD